MVEPRLGGSFAPPLSDELLAKYEATIRGLPESPVKDALKALLKMCRQWWELPDSYRAGGKPHPVGVGYIRFMDDEYKDALWEAVPWKEELEMYSLLFEKIDPVAEKPLRDMAFHLLWHGRELEQDREPLTCDKL